MRSASAPSLGVPKIDAVNLGPWASEFAAHETICHCGSVKNSGSPFRCSRTYSLPTAMTPEISLWRSQFLQAACLQGGTLSSTLSHHGNALPSCTNACRKPGSTITTDSATGCKMDIHHSANFDDTASPMREDDSNSNVSVAPCRPAQQMLAALLRAANQLTLSILG